MNRFLLDLAALSLGGGAVVLLLLLAARLTRGRYAARWRCTAWLLLSLRLAVPFPLLPHLGPAEAPVQLTVPSNPVVFTYSPPVSQPPAASSRPAQSQAAPSRSEPVQNAVQPEAPAESGGFSLSLAQLLLILWLLGAAGVLLWNVGCHLRFCRWLRRWGREAEETPLLARYRALEDQMGLRRLPRLVLCPSLPAPMLAGLLRPVILLPEPLPQSAPLECALRHELTHFRRRDIPLKALVLWVKALHWFNPLMWLMARAVEQDTELACDDSTLHALPGDQRSAYGRSILQAVSAVQNRKEEDQS